jgi:hypothetical protein
MKDAPKLPPPLSTTSVKILPNKITIISGNKQVRNLSIPVLSASPFSGIHFLSPFKLSDF